MVEKTKKPKSSFVSYTFTASSFTNGNKSEQKTLEVLNKNGKISGLYQEVENGKVTKKEKVTDKVLKTLTNKKNLQ